MKRHLQQEQRTHGTALLRHQTVHRPSSPTPHRDRPQNRTNTSRYRSVTGSLLATKHCSPEECPNQTQCAKRDGLRVCRGAWKGLGHRSHSNDMRIGPRCASRRSETLAPRSVRLQRSDPPRGRATVVALGRRLARQVAGHSTLRQGVLYLVKRGSESYAGINGHRPHPRSFEGRTWRRRMAEKALSLPGPRQTGQEVAYLGVILSELGRDSIRTKPQAAMSHTLSHTSIAWDTLPPSGASDTYSKCAACSSPTRGIAALSQRGN